MMKTIAKNRVAKFLPRVRNIVMYSLDNGFNGTQVENLDWAIKMEAKFVWDGISKGKARCHSNLWYEFDIA